MFVGLVYAVYKLVRYVKQLGNTYTGLIVIGTKNPIATYIQPNAYIVQPIRIEGTRSEICKL